MKVRHDVVAHLHVYAEQCPKAGPILHHGATSCYIKDNAVGVTLVILSRGSLYMSYVYILVKIAPPTVYIYWLR